MCHGVVLLISVYKNGLILTHTCTFSHIFRDLGTEATFFIIFNFLSLPVKVGDGVSFSTENDASSFEASLFLLVRTCSGRFSFSYKLGFMPIAMGILIFASELLLEESFGVIKLEVGTLYLVGLKDIDNLVFYLFGWGFAETGLKDLSRGTNGIVTCFFKNLIFYGLLSQVALGLGTFGGTFVPFWEFYANFYFIFRSLFICKF